MANNFSYQFKRIAAPESNAEALKTYARRVNTALEDLYTKLYGYVRMEDLAEPARKVIDRKIESKDLASYSTITQTTDMIGTKVGAVDGRVTAVEQ
ncbi:MAG: hypothetical protein RR893_11970, partial [Clostridia bacterium]